MRQLPLNIEKAKEQGITNPLIYFVNHGYSVAEGVTLTIPEGVTITVNGTIAGAGSLVIDGTITGTGTWLGKN